MSKREKSVQVTIDEQKLPDGQKASILKIGSDTIGTVTPVEDRFEAQLNDGDVYRVKSVDEGVDLGVRGINQNRG